MRADDVDELKQVAWEVVAGADVKLLRAVLERIAADEARRVPMEPVIEQVGGVSH